MLTQLPNTITLFNLFFGVCALIQVANHRPDLALWFLLGSFACDTADGLIARALKVSGPLGKQLDSLADVVSFGVVPGFMLYQLLLPANTIGMPFVAAALPAFIFSMLAAYRLGKFNIDTRQSSYFLGLSTPAATLVVLGLTLGAYYNRFGFGDFIQNNHWLLYAITVVLGVLMVSELPLAGLKISGFRWRGNEALLLLLLLFSLLLWAVQELAFALIVVAYIAYSIAFRKKITTH